jgi:hypothetical protein
MAVPAIGMMGLTACSPAQMETWLSWNAQDPTAAQEWANTPEGQSLIHNDSDGDGVVEPDAPQGGGGSGSVVAITNGGRWDRIARCESGGNWSYPPVTNRTGTYSGGLMIGHRWWGPNGGKQYAEWPYLATKAEQIAVAEVIWSKSGQSAWDCHG